jgi:hypothetical protein
VEIGHDPRQRRPHNGLVQREEEHREEDRAENLELGAGAQLHPDGISQSVGHLVTSFSYVSFVAGDDINRT